MTGRNPGDAMMWEVHHDGKVQSMTEVDLRAMLQENK
ncbi:MAG: hypothetical protein ACJAV2_002494, partial [Myxococcota bacterium]